LQINFGLSSTQFGSDVVGKGGGVVGKIGRVGTGSSGFSKLSKHFDIDDFTISTFDGLIPKKFRSMQVLLTNPRKSILTKPLKNEGSIFSI
jgi:hypothetical protein